MAPKFNLRSAEFLLQKKLFFLVELASLTFYGNHFINSFTLLFFQGRKKRGMKITHFPFQLQTQSNTWLQHQKSVDQYGSNSATAMN